VRQAISRMSVRVRLAGILRQAGLSGWASLTQRKLASLQ